MAILVSKENNILKVDNTTKIRYMNASWVSMSFTATAVSLLDNSLPTNSPLQNPYVIPFTEFQDGAGSPINTEVAIATYLSDKIG